MSYISAQQAADKWGISKRRVQTLCAEQRIKDAVRIGNMWVIPDDAGKPSDGRQSHTDRLSPTPKEARTALKKLSVAGYREIADGLDGRGKAKMVFISLLASALFRQIMGEEAAPPMLSVFLTVSGDAFDFEGGEGEKRALFERFSALSERISAYISTYHNYIEDVLSWAYQYVNKESRDSGLENTQFFTERYMIEYLTGDLFGEGTTEREGKCLDPACGGGNFLSHILGKLVSSKPCTAEAVRQALAAVWGYELDPHLAAVASINLKLKALSILSGSKQIHLEDWKLFFPQIYTSVEPGGFGFLEDDFGKHSVRRVSDGKRATLRELTDDTMALYTNPPFQTVKGMPKVLKDHLKQRFPLAKCDICNAFLLQCLEKVRPGGVIGLVTQCSWMYLDSFAALRYEVLSSGRLEMIADLGAGSFYDLNGEKANVALVRMRRVGPSDEDQVKMLILRDKPLEEKIRLLSQDTNAEATANADANTADLFRPRELFCGPYTAFSPPGSRLTEARTAVRPYKEYATPMQGTSTGNAAELISYYWEHLNDTDWVPVSKGGGYSRWCGLNSYLLKWGRDGEYIRATKGSALRNTKYFHRTGLVYSDTGTAGFNARLLEPGQLFVASGPGIRDIAGDPFAHLTLLNGRLFSSCLRRLSPKLTVAAGYIGRVSVPEGLLELPALARLGRRCYQEKRRFLERRPNQLEWRAPSPDDTVSTLDGYAVSLFQEDIFHELEKLRCEAEIDQILLEAYQLDHRERLELDASFGKPAAELTGEPVTEGLDQLMARMLDGNCQLSRTRVDKQTMGCDGLLEYISRKENADPRLIADRVLTQPERFAQCIRKYKEFCIHNLLLSALGFRTEFPEGGTSLGTLRRNFQLRYPHLQDQWSVVRDWLETDFETFHQKAFCGRPYYRYYNGRFTILY